MLAKDVMTTAVATVRPETPVRDVAALLLQRRISAVPVVDGDGALHGIVSEGDLIRRPEMGTERRPSWWLSLVATPDDRALAYVKSHGGKAGDVMTRKVLSVEDTTPLEDVAEVLEANHVKRVPVMRGGKLVGIVSRADLLRGLVARRDAPAPSPDDVSRKAAIDKAFADAGIRAEMISVTVSGGVVRLWGAAMSDTEKQAARVAAESLSGAGEVRDDIQVLDPNVRAVLWAE